MLRRERNSGIIESLREARTFIGVERETEYRETATRCIELIRGTTEYKQDVSVYRDAADTTD